MKPKYGVKTKLYYIDTDSFITQIKTEDSYVEIVKDVETRFNTSNDELNKPLPREKIKEWVD